MAQRGPGDRLASHTCCQSERRITESPPRYRHRVSLRQWRQRSISARSLAESFRLPIESALFNWSQTEARILELTGRGPTDGSTHWSSYRLAKEVGVSQSTVSRVWRQFGLQPHRSRSYMVSDDPEFEEKAADIIGLYLKPPVHAAVFCVDEKSAIQALDRLDPVLPLSAGRAERHGFEYYRHGTLSL